MKKWLVFIIMLSGYIAGVQRLAAQSVAEEALPEFFFRKGVIFDFKDVPEGPPAVHVFEFLNKGKTPLILSSVTAACGCAAVVWTEEPVLPGSKGTVTVQYNTDGRVGPFSKDVIVHSNAKSTGQGSIVLGVKGVVQAKEPELPATGYTKE
jgi:hypothetical protein